MKVRIEFPDDIAQQKAEEAQEWQPGTPMIWEAEDLNQQIQIKKENNKIIIKTEHTKVELTKEELKKAAELIK